MEKKKGGEPEVILIAEFSGAHDAWVEHLCIERNADGTISLSSRSHAALAEVADFVDDEGGVRLPEAVDGVRVGGYEGNYVVGEHLLTHDDEAEITLVVGAVTDAEVGSQGVNGTRRRATKTPGSGLRRHFRPAIAERQQRRTAMQ